MSEVYIHPVTRQMLEDLALWSGTSEEFVAMYAIRELHDAYTSREPDEARLIPANPHTHPPDVA